MKARRKLLLLSGRRLVKVFAWGMPSIDLAQKFKERTVEPLTGGVLRNKVEEDKANPC
jgi:hypothetical protein